MEMHFDWTFFWQSLFHPSGAFLAGLGMTVAISVVSMVLGLVLGLIVALMRLSRNRALRIIASVYVWILQGIPLLVVLVVIYLGLAAANIYKFQDTSVMGVVLAGSGRADGSLHGVGDDRFFLDAVDHSSAGGKDDDPPAG